MASTPITAQTSAAVMGPLRDLTDGPAAVAGKGPSKAGFISSVTRFPEARKIKVAKNPPPPPARVTKVTTEKISAANAPSTAVPVKTNQIFGNDKPSYDDAYDLRIAGSDLQSSLKQRELQESQKDGRGPPDGAATCESTCSLTGCVSPLSSPTTTQSASITSHETAKPTDSANGTATTEPTNTNVSTFTSNTASFPARKSNPVPEQNGDESALLRNTTESDRAGVMVTPTPSNNTNWFPPPPPTPLHLTLHVEEPVGSQPGRYHEHRRSFELDDDQMSSKMVAEAGDSITLPPISPPPPPPQLDDKSVNGCASGGRASVSSFLLNLPPPPPMTDMPSEGTPSPPAIPPRDPKTSVTTPTDVLVTDLDVHPPTLVASDPSTSKLESGGSDKAKDIYQRKPLFDGRSVVPWERAGPGVVTTTAMDMSGSLPQWVPPQHSEAAVLQARVPKTVSYLSSKSQSEGDDPLDGGSEGSRAVRPLSLAAGGRSQSQHRGRRHTTHSFGDDLMEATQTTPTNARSCVRPPMRMNSDNTGMSKVHAMNMPNNMWASAMVCNGSDSAGQRFVRIRQHHPGSRSQHQQHQQPANHRKALATAAAVAANAAALAEADMMTQSLIEWPGCDATSPVSSGLHHHQRQQQQRICRRMKAFHLTDSGLVLSPQDASSLPVYHRGRRVFFSSPISKNSSPEEALQHPSLGGGFLLQSQVSCPPKMNGVDEGAVWTDGRVFDYQTAPANGYHGQAYMVWPKHQLVSGQRRRRHQNRHHHTTQPIVVPTSDEAPFPMDRRAVGAKITMPHSDRPQVLVTGRNCGKRAADLAALVSLPVEEQPWFHGRLPRAEAESLLRSAPPGSFLVRTSETSKAAFSLSIRRDRDFLHMKISYDPKSEAFILGEYSQPYPTVPIMVHHYTRNLLPVRGTKPVLLKYPLCRGISPFALQTP